MSVLLAEITEATARRRAISERIRERYSKKPEREPEPQATRYPFLPDVLRRICGRQVIKPAPGEIQRKLYGENK